MATGTILLPLIADFDTTNPPGIRIKNDTRQPVFDDTTPEIMRCKFQLPTDYSSGLTLKGMITMVGANTGTKEVRLGAALDAIDHGEDGGTESFDTENTADVTINNTAEYRVDFSITLTNADSAAALDEITLKFRRVADHANDDAVGDAALLIATLQYTTT